MKCATCHDPMIVVEHEHVELDYCLNCGGVWFDSGEIELLLETMQLDSTGLEDLHLTDEAASREDKHKCPECDRRMKKVALGSEPVIIIDACPEGHGLWFDDGEVGQLIVHLASKQTGDDSQERVISFLGDVIKVRPWS